MKIKMQIKELCRKFKEGYAIYKNENYNEAQLRNDFLDPFFEILGWDIINKKGKFTSEREVLVEEVLKRDTNENIKKPDYTFRLYSERKFFVEAKKPSIKIEKEDKHALQVRSYGYTSALKISILSNFEYLFIYDTSSKPKIDDDRSKFLIKSYHYSEYEEKIFEILELIGRESIYSGKFDDIWRNIEANKENIPVDKQFLKQINVWRLNLAKDILKVDNSISVELLGDIVQSYINKILFLRVCEDRNIEKYQRLLNIANKSNINKLIELFHKADLKYNSGLFDELLTPNLMKNISSTFWKIVKELYYPNSVYSYTVLSSEILGNIYELFIAQKIIIENDEVKVINKPENEDKDIITTPSFIVKEIIRNNVLKKIKNYSFDQLCGLKFADISCGSGTFLIELFQSLCDFSIDYFIKNDKTKLIQIGINNFKLPFKYKLIILKNCIFGLDKDYNAVEATKFGLLLKSLEDEDFHTLNFTYPLLPDLSCNILYGNSLFDYDDVPEKLRTTINPIDLNNLKFDFIIGNPPYLDSEFMKKTTPIEYKIYPQFYKSAYKQYDKYFLFIERGIKLLRNNGILAYIIPNKFMKVGSAKRLREILTKNKYLSSIISFGANQIFSDKTNYTCILTIAKEERDIFTYQEVTELDTWKARSGKNLISKKNISIISSNTWVLFPDTYTMLYKKINRFKTTLSDIVGNNNIFNGIQTSANKIYTFKPVYEDNSIFKFIKNGNVWEIEKQLTKPYFMTEREGEIICNSYRTFIPNARVIFPYIKNIDGRLEIISLGELKIHYPKAYKYFKYYKDCLTKRDIKPKPENDNEWYRYGRHQNLEACELQSKLVVGVLSQGEKYAVDTNQTLISSGGTAGYCAICLPSDSPYSIYYIQALLSSRPIEWMASLYGEIFRGGFIARGTKVLKQLPFRTIDFDDKEEIELHNSISNLQQQLIELGDKINLTKNNKRKTIYLDREFVTKKNKLDTNIQKLFSMTNEEYNLIPNISNIYK